MIKFKKTITAVLSTLFLTVGLNSITIYGQDNPTSVKAAAWNASINRIYGQDRYETSVDISKNGWVTSDYVIIATGQDFPDALTAAALAKVKNAPILLTEKDSLKNIIIDEIKRLQCKEAFLIGGTGVISTNVENQLNSMGVKTNRLGGKDRYETSEKVAEIVGVNNGIITATGADFPDALSIAPIAGIKGMPILLSPKAGLDSSVSSFLSGKSIPVSYIVGGSGVLDSSIDSALTNSKRLSWDDRYGTNIKINTQFKGDVSFDTVYLATGNDFPDALSCSALAAKNNSPLFLTDKSSISAVTYYFMKDMNVKNVVIIGGTSVVSQSIGDVIMGKASPPEDTSSIPGITTNTGDSKQAIVVLADSYGTIHAALSAYESKDGYWQKIKDTSAVLGINGFSDDRHEGDLTTPTGIYHFPFLFGNGGNAGFSMPYRYAGVGDYWVSNQTLDEYNVWMHYDGDPTTRFYDYEALWKQPLYKYAALIDFNYGPGKVMGKGSGIFLHIAPYGGGGTLGCVGVNESDLLSLLKWMNPDDNPCIVMGVKGHV